MDDSCLQWLAEQHLDGDPTVLARLREVPEWAEVLDALDRVVADLRALRD